MENCFCKLKIKSTKTQEFSWKRLMQQQTNYRTSVQCVKFKVVRIETDTVCIFLYLSVVE